MRRESLPTQGEFDLDGTKANHDGHLDASIIDRAGATEIVDESDQGDRDPLASWKELTRYHGDINPRKPSAMRDLWCAIIERAGSFDRTADRTQFMFRAAGPVIDALVEAHRDEYTEEDGRLRSAYD